MTDSIRLLANRQAYVERWLDWVNAKNSEPEKTPEEIIQDTIKKGGLTII